MLGKCLEAVRNASPLIHNITNYVTVNDVANILLASGGRPIMANEELEVEEITSICSGLYLNIGTINRTVIPSMIKAGKRANALNHPVVLDPVGAGASEFRTATARRLLEEIRFTVIRGNISEIKALALGESKTQGVEANVADVVTEENLDGAVAFVKAFARSQNCVAAVTGAIDLVSDGEKCYVIRNGREEMERVTGAGCQLSGLTAAYAAANPGEPLMASAASVCAMGLAGEKALERLKEGEGNATYRNRIIDAIYLMTGEELERGANYELR